SMRSFAPMTASTSAWSSKIMKQAQQAGVSSPARIHSIFMMSDPTGAQSPSSNDVTPQAGVPAMVQKLSNEINGLGMPWLCRVRIVVFHNEINGLTALFRAPEFLPVPCGAGNHG